VVFLLGVAFARPIQEMSAARVGKAKASSLGVGHLADARDNKSVAEIGERHHLLLAGDDLCGTGGQE